MRRIAMCFLVVGAVLLAAGMTWAQAQEPGAPAKRPMMTCQDRFAAIDANKDGVVTFDEFMAARHRGGSARAEEIFRARDANGDGKVTQEEFCARRKPPGQGRGRGPAPQL